MPVHRRVHSKVDAGDVQTKNRSDREAELVAFSAVPCAPTDREESSKAPPLCIPHLCNGSRAQWIVQIDL